jgi:hypothetical protein
MDGPQFMKLTPSPKPAQGTSMTDTADLPFVHEASGSVRFWVVIGERVLGASVSILALHHRYQPSMQDDIALETFRTNQADIEAAVRRKFAQGCLEPVMLREYDLRPQ